MSDWKNMLQWEMVLPPSRPTYIELNRIHNFILHFDRSKPIAILGSTPEFRDLLQRMGFTKIFCFDKSPIFYENMKSLFPSYVNRCDTLIEGDWTDSLKLYTSYFSCILSDLTMGNMTYESRKKFYSDIANALLPSGVFIDKVLAFDFEVPSLKSLFSKYEQLPINLRTVNDFSSEVLFCSELVKDNNIVDSSLFYSHIREGDYSPRIKLFAEKAHMITPEGFVWYYGQSWDLLKHEYFSNFSKVFVFQETDKDSPYYLRTKQFFNIK